MENIDRDNISSKNNTSSKKREADNLAPVLTGISNKSTQKTTTPDIGPTSSPSNSQSLEGKVIKDRYRIERLIGHGGMCDVYQATDLLREASGNAEPYVALKVLQREYLNQSGAAKILIREAQKTQQLSHPNIIRVFDFGGDKLAPYLVMEWLDGETLEEVIRRSRPNGLPFKSAITLLNQIISALKYAHSQGVIHADLKPSNIMLTRDGTIKLFDFGVSKAFSLHTDDYSAEAQHETNALCGYTPTYASPALLQGKEPEAKDDIFAFSTIAYELLTSQHPFDRKPADIAQQSGMTAVKPNHLSFIKWRTLRQGLDFSAGKRIASFSELQDQLNTRLAPKIAIVTAMLCVALSLGYGYQQQDKHIEQLSARLLLSNQASQEEHQLTQLTPSQFIAALPTLPKDKPLLIDGLLRQKHQQIISVYEQRINNILNNRHERYPDYYAIEKELINAQNLYPDSLVLYSISEEITASWQSTVKILVQRLNTLLERGQYHPDGDDDIAQLLADLNQVSFEYQFKPTEKANKTFSKSFEDAEKNLDLASIRQLIHVGELLFSNTSSQQSQLAAGRKLKESIQIMTDYQSSLSEGTLAEYPYQAAALYYQNSFDELNTRLGNIKNVTQLDALNNDVGKIAEQLPDDFSPLIQIRLAMATEYLNFSEALLKANKGRTANMVMKKANNLFAEVEKARSAY